ncbi:hypothetical protein V5N11_011727 [Cardamine amara subsp. amara]|uniref:DUF7610 domain-containing protein n=1 Tax=Cardamine amara subsp. amara TaxID=228776 RepID=A0ABD1AQN3_CARAN
MGENKMVKKRMKTKTKANTILEKKLEELECLLLESGSGNGDLTAYREFNLRFLFTQTLLTAEISSVKDDDEEEMLKLRCMAKRLTELGEAFKELTGINVGGVVVNVDYETGSVFPFVELLQEEYQDASLEETLEDSLARRKTEKIKTKRFRGLVSFGIVGFVAGMVSFYGYLCDQMNEETSFITPT